MKTDCVAHTMANIVEGYLEAYKDDFYRCDLERLFRIKPGEFAWFIRSTGTHMISSSRDDNSDPDYWRECYELFKRHNEKFYYVKVNEDGSGEVTLSEKKCDDFARRATDRLRRTIASSTKEA